MRFKRLKKILKNFGLLWQALRKFNDDNGFFLSSGIAFNILINLIPFIMLLLALVGTYLYNDQEVLDHIRAYFRDVAPALDPKITGNLIDLIQKHRILGILGFAGLLWLSTWVFGSLRIALNIVFRAEKSRGMLGTGQTSFHLVCRPSGRVLHFLWLIKKENLGWLTD